MGELGREFKAKHDVSWKDMYRCGIKNQTLLQFVESFEDIFDVDIDAYDDCNRTLTPVTLYDAPGGYALIEDMGGGDDEGSDEADESDLEEAEEDKEKEDEEGELDMNTYMPPELREGSWGSRGRGVPDRVERSRSRSRDRGRDRDDCSMRWRSQDACLDPSDVRCRKLATSSSSSIPSASSTPLSSSSSSSSSFSSSSLLSHSRLSEPYRNENRHCQYSSNIPCRFFQGLYGCARAGQCGYVHYCNRCDTLDRGTSALCKCRR